MNPKLTFFPAGDMEPSNLKLFLGLFFTDFVKTMIIPQTNMGLSGQDELTLGEFLRFLGLWLLMSTIIGPQQHEFWASYPIEAFRGAPLQLGCWMSQKWFKAIFGALMYTNKDPPAQGMSTNFGKFAKCSRSGAIICPLNSIQDG